MVIYDRYDIVFQEIPNEVSLAFTLKGCLNNCKGCHSPHLRELDGDELTEDFLLELLNKYRNQVTTVLFLGGDKNPLELRPLLKLCRSNGFKTAWYSGLDVFLLTMEKYLDYYKIGSYKEKLGGLSNKNTNQRLLKIINGKLEDITHMFWR